MFNSSDSSRRQRSRDCQDKLAQDRSGIFNFLKNPRTLKLIFKIGFCADRVWRFVLRVSELFE